MILAAVWVATRKACQRTLVRGHCGTLLTPCRSMAPKTRVVKAKQKRDAVERGVVGEGALTDPALGNPVPSREDSWDEMAAIAGESEELAELATRARSLVTVNTYSDNTIRAYSNAWRRFEDWCSDHELQSLPASPMVVVLYIAHLDSRGVGKEVMITARAAIAWRHSEHGFESPAAHHLVAEVSAGAVRRKASAGEAKPVVRAHPLSVSELRTLMAALPKVRTKRRPREEQLMRICLRSQLLAGWHLGRRGDELVRAEISWVQADGDGVRFTTPYEKRKPRGFSNIMMPTEDEAICPVRALQEWLEASAPYRNGVTRLWCDVDVGENGEPVLVDRLGELMAARHPDDDLPPSLRGKSRGEVEANLRAEALSRATGLFRARLQQWMKKAGIEPIGDDRRLSSHSARRGLTTSAREAGIDLEAIARHVGWSSLEMAKLYSDHRPDGHPLEALGL